VGGAKATDQNRRTWSADCSVEDLPDSGTVASSTLSVSKIFFYPFIFLKDSAILFFNTLK
jgi:hypothetical protein